MNAVKHGQATHADVFLRRTGDRIELTVMDNGKGFASPPNGLPAPSIGGFGLFSIHERIRHVGGALTIDSIPGEGTEVMLSVPFDPVSNAPQRTQDTTAYPAVSNSRGSH
jgi:signal transduction histidine kinase